MSILVTGGAGYIGSVTVEMLRKRGEDVVVLDNLVYGHREALHDEIVFYKGDISDSELVKEIIDKHDIDSCLHFAAYAYVGESVTEPAKYFENNVSKAISLLNSLLAANVKAFVFSSTCATYGEPQYVPIDEKHPQNPTNPYGWTKLMFEKVLASYNVAYCLRYVALRYFNACGAAGECGEHHDPETHLIPNILSAADGGKKAVSVFGDDYPTPDGTCIRDYIHVTDLADAHVRALDHLRAGKDSIAVNLGNGTGYSVFEVIESARKVTGLTIDIDIQPRREGDPSKLVADASLAAKVLGWKPQIGEIDLIIRSAWDWKMDNPKGYVSKDLAAK